MSEPELSFGQWLVLLRANMPGDTSPRKGRHIRTGASQEELAHRLGVSVMSVKRWELDHRYPLPFWARVFKILAQDYGLPPPPERPPRASRGGPKA